VNQAAPGTGGNLGRVRVTASDQGVLDSRFDVDGRLNNVVVGGRRNGGTISGGHLRDSSIQANRLGRVAVLHGDITGAADTIHANGGRFLIFDQDDRALVSPADPSVFFDGLEASVS
jgi:hypothetical protein